MPRDPDDIAAAAEARADAAQARAEERRRKAEERRRREEPKRGHIVTASRSQDGVFHFTNVLGHEWTSRPMVVRWDDTKHGAWERALAQAAHDAEGESTALATPSKLVEWQPRLSPAKADLNNILGDDWRERYISSAERRPAPESAGGRRLQE